MRENLKDALKICLMNNLEQNGKILVKNRSLKKFSMHGRGTHQEGRGWLRQKHNFFNQNDPFMSWWNVTMESLTIILKFWVEFLPKNLHSKCDNFPPFSLTFKFSHHRFSQTTSCLCIMNSKQEAQRHKDEPILKTGNCSLTNLLPHPSSTSTVKVRLHLGEDCILWINLWICGFVDFFSAGVVGNTAWKIIAGEKKNMGNQPDSPIIFLPVILSSALFLLPLGDHSNYLNLNTKDGVMNCCQLLGILLEMKNHKKNTTRRPFWPFWGGLIFLFDKKPSSRQKLPLYSFKFWKFLKLFSKSKFLHTIFPRSILSLFPKPVNHFSSWKTSLSHPPPLGQTLWDPRGKLWKTWKVWPKFSSAFSASSLQWFFADQSVTLKKTCHSPRPQGGGGRPVIDLYT